MPARWGLQHVEQAQPDAGHLLDRQRPTGLQRLGERAPRQQLHDDPGTTVVLDQVMNGDGSVVMDTCGGARLGEGPPQRRRARLLRHRIVRNELFERYRSIQQLVLGEPDQPHTAAAQHRLELVAAGDQPPPAGLDGRIRVEIGRDRHHGRLRWATQTTRTARAPTR
jgi:hypothetical protein